MVDETPNANIGIPTGEKSAGWYLMWMMVVMKLYRLLNQHMEIFRIRLLLLPQRRSSLYLQIPRRQEHS